MANNRMYLVCKKCDPGPEYAKDIPSRFYLAKYYPSSGWFNYQQADYAQRMNEFFDIHRHNEGALLSGAVGSPFGPMYEGERYGTMFGNENIRLEYEVEPD